MATDEQLLDRAVARILRGMMVIGVAASALLLALKGWTWGAGFALGAVVSWFNFR